MTNQRIRRESSSESIARRQVARTLSPMIRRFGAWQQQLAVAAARSSRAHTDSERSAMLATCGRISAEITETRTDIVAGLADAPQLVRRHSRVVDLEKALGEIEANMGDILRRLGHRRGAARPDAAIERTSPS